MPRPLAARPLAALALPAAALLALSACSSAVDGIPSSAAATSAAVPSEESSDQPVVDDSTDDGYADAVEDGEYPEPGAGVTGDDGLCQAVAGWYAFTSLALLTADDSGYVAPEDLLPLLAALQEAPEDHQDASGDLLDAADAVTAAAADSADAVEAGTDAVTALDQLTGPITAFGDACSAAGVTS